VDSRVVVCIREFLLGHCHLVKTHLHFKSVIKYTYPGVRIAKSAWNWSAGWKSISVMAKTIFSSPKFPHQLLGPAQPHGQWVK
jgi:hypothetical protein